MSKPSDEWINLKPALMEDVIQQMTDILCAAHSVMNRRVSPNLVHILVLDIVAHHQIKKYPDEIVTPEEYFNLISNTLATAKETSGYAKKKIANSGNHGNN